MGFIQVDQGVVTYRKTLRLARLLGEDCYTITGRLVALWTWCLDSAISGSLANIEPDILADVMGYPGRSSELIAGLITVGFLDLDDDGHLSIHKCKCAWGSSSSDAPMRPNACAGSAPVAPMARTSPLPYRKRTASTLMIVATHLPLALTL